MSPYIYVAALSIPWHSAGMFRGSFADSCAFHEVTSHTARSRIRGKNGYGIFCVHNGDGRTVDRAQRSERLMAEMMAFSALVVMEESMPTPQMIWDSASSPTWHST